MRKTIAVAGILAAALGAVIVANQLALRQRDYRVLLLRGDDALRRDETFDAIEAYSGAIALRPDSMLAYLRRGETYRRRADRGDLEAAARDFKKAASLDDRAAMRPLEELGDVTYQLRRFDRAIDAYANALRVDDRSARLSYKLALARYRQLDVSGAIAALTQAVRLDDRMADAYYLLGVCEREAGRTADALHAQEKAVALSPALIPAREELADLYAMADRRGDQIGQLQLLSGLDRDHVDRAVALALAHARARRWDTAVVVLSSALERAPNDPTLYGALGQIWLESAIARDDRAELGKAREALERAASTSTASSETLLLSARAAIEDGDFDNAERTLQNATGRYPVELPALLLLASTAERQNHADAARRALLQYEALVTEDGDFVAHASKIAALSARLDDFATAAEWARRGLDKDPQNPQLQALWRRASPPSSDQFDGADRAR
jgi:tetratricopeptide (TPR) repeat protein